MLKILVIENQPVMLRGLEMLLRGHYRSAQVAGVQDISAFTNPGPAFTPDVVILGICEDTLKSSYLTISAIKSAFKCASLIAFEQSGNQQNVPECFERGVRGYLSKDSDLEEVIQCIDTVLEGRPYMSSKSILSWISNLPSQRAVFRKQKTESGNVLSYRQRQIAELLATGVKVKLIADQLGLKISTVSTVKKVIFKKLNIDNIVALKTAIN